MWLRLDHVNPNRKLQSSSLRAAPGFCGQVAWAAVHVHAGTGLRCQVEAFLWSATGLLISQGLYEVWLKHSKQIQPVTQLCTLSCKTKNLGHHFTVRTCQAGNNRSIFYNIWYIEYTVSFSHLPLHPESSPSSLSCCPPHPSLTQHSPLENCLKPTVYRDAPCVR